MTTTAINNEIMKFLPTLGKTQQEKVLSFLKSLAQNKNTSASQLLSFAGSIPQNELKQMQQAIQQGCEHIDDHEW